jgi:hypothetical protein
MRATGVWIERAGIVDANGAIGPHCQRGADLFVDYPALRS